MNILGIIPARYASTRLEGKPLADIHGKPMIQHVYERATKVLKEVVVATDDPRIFKAVEEFGGHAVMTSKGHHNGTSRCLEAYQTYAFEHDLPVDVVINIQGDEPMLDPHLLRKLADCFEETEVEMATLATAVKKSDELKDTSSVFVVLAENGNALYFSRSPIPHVQGQNLEDWAGRHPFYRHIGLYAFRPKALQKFASMPPGNLEKAESLEQLRWLEAGKQIKVELIAHSGISVDTPADLEKVREMMHP